MSERRLLCIELGTTREIASRTVEVVSIHADNIYEPIARISIHHRQTGSSEQIVAKRADVIPIGDMRYVVFAVIETVDVRRGFVALAKKE